MHKDMDAESWIGRQHRTCDILDLNRARAMEAALNRKPRLHPGDPLPPCWHWLYFWDLAPAGDLGPDGHQAHGEFLPPTGLPRRMLAGGRVWFDRPLDLGDEVVRTSTIQKVQEKQGRSGQLVFVTLRHEIADRAGTAIREEQDLVFREAGAGNGAAPAAPDRAAWVRDIRPDGVQLFRYSALTYNGHRIHYDRPYAQEVEGYRDLVVHGPLLATLLLDALTDEGGQGSPTFFGYRAISPLFVGECAQLCGRPNADGGTDLWVAGPQGGLCMQATATD